MEEIQFYLYQSSTVVKSEVNRATEHLEETYYGGDTLCCVIAQKHLDCSDILIILVDTNVAPLDDIIDEDSDLVDAVKLSLSKETKVVAYDLFTGDFIPLGFHEDFITTFNETGYDTLESILEADSEDYFKHVPDMTEDDYYCSKSTKTLHTEGIPLYVCGVSSGLISI
jgi:hypothetical protein